MFTSDMMEDIGLDLVLIGEVTKDLNEYTDIISIVSYRGQVREIILDDKIYTFSFYEGFYFELQSYRYPSFSLWFLDVLCCI